MREQLVDVGDAKLWVARGGSGPPLLLSSGGPGFGDYLAPVAGMLDDLADVIRWEQRGCGRSEGASRYDLATCISDMERLRSWAGAERWIVGGHSWGADLSLVYALEHPERTRAVLHVAGKGFQNDRYWSAEYHAELERRGERQPEAGSPPNMDVNAAGNHAFRRYVQRPDLWRRVAELRVPVLLVAAGRDVRPAWPVEQLEQLLPRARLVRIEGAEHLIWTTHARELRDALRAFLSELASPPGEPN